MNLVQHLAALAREVGQGDFIEPPSDVDLDWLYTHTAEAVLSRYLEGDKDHRDEILLASTIHLVVENTLLHKKLLMMTGD